MGTTLGTRLRAQRLQHGWTLADLSKLMHCSPSHILRIERDESLPSLPFLARLLSHFNMSDLEIADLIRSAGQAGDDPSPAGELGVAA